MHFNGRMQRIRYFSIYKCSKFTNNGVIDAHRIVLAESSRDGIERAARIGNEPASLYNLTSRKYYETF